MSGNQGTIGIEEAEANLQGRSHMDEKVQTIPELKDQLSLAPQSINASERALPQLGKCKSLILLAAIGSSGIIGVIIYPSLQCTPWIMLRQLLQSISTSAAILITPNLAEDYGVTQLQAQWVSNLLHFLCPIPLHSIL